MSVSLFFFQLARAAQKEWEKVDWDERRAVLMDLNDWILENQQTILQWASNDSGKNCTSSSSSSLFVSSVLCFLRKFSCSSFSFLSSILCYSF
jgi:acyl-CoA reductase-like NAD-dependent aldehyde dehydrogenase